MCNFLAPANRRWLGYWRRIVLSATINLMCELPRVARTLRREEARAVRQFLSQVKQVLAPQRELRGANVPPHKGINRRRTAIGALEGLGQTVG
jgi:hypothetical protein